MSKLKIIKLHSLEDILTALDKGVKSGEVFWASIKVKKRRRFRKVKLVWFEGCECCGGYHKIVPVASQIVPKVV